MLLVQAARHTARAVVRAGAPRASSSSSASPVRQFFANGVPIDVYPLIFLTGGVATFAMFSISKHIFQDRDHLRWLPGKGGVKYELRPE